MWAPENGGEASRRFSQPRPGGPAGPPCRGWGEIAMFPREARALGDAADRAGRITWGEGRAALGGRQRAVLASFGVESRVRPGKRRLRCVGSRESGRARG